MFYLLTVAFVLALVVESSGNNIKLWATVVYSVKVSFIVVSGCRNVRFKNWDIYYEAPSTFYKIYSEILKLFHMARRKIVDNVQPDLQTVSYSK
jgi:hypothetical protein